MVGSVGNLGTIHAPPPLPKGGDASLAMLSLIADPQRAQEAQTWVRDALATLEANRETAEAARAALAEARKAQREAADAKADAEAERSALRVEQAEEKRRREAERSTLAREAERLDAWATDLRQREAACGKLADRLARASAALSEWQEGAKS